MAEFHQEFGISRKAVATTRNNGADYVSVFNLFGVTEGDSDREAEEEDAEVVDSTSILVEEVLDYDSLLPKHGRCWAHKVSLLACKDMNKAPWLRSCSQASLLQVCWQGP